MQMAACEDGDTWMLTRSQHEAKSTYATAPMNRTSVSLKVVSRQVNLCSQSRSEKETATHLGFDVHVPGAHKRLSQVGF